MFTLKPISRDSVDGALAKAERYRLLNEPTKPKASAATFSKLTRPTGRRASA